MALCIVLLYACAVALLILSIAYYIAVVREHSVHRLRVGDCEIPIHEKDLRQAYPEAVKLIIAEIEASARKKARKNNTPSDT